MSDDLVKDMLACADLDQDGFPVGVKDLNLHLGAQRIRELEAENAALREARGTPAQAARVLLDEWRHGEGPLGDLACYSMDEDGVMRPDIDGRWTEFSKIEAALFRASLADAGEAGK